MVTHDYTFTEYGEEQENNVEIMASVDIFDDNGRFDITIWDGDGDAITLTKDQFRNIERFVETFL